MTDAPPPDTPPPAHPEPGHDPFVEHEGSDVNVRAILGFAAGLVALAVVIHLLLAWMFFAFLHREERAKRSTFPLAAPGHAALPQPTLGAPVGGELPGGPQLEGLNLEKVQHDVGRERREGTAPVKNTQEEQRLRGSEPIPIEKAMRLVVEERKPQGREPAPVRYDQGVSGTGGGSNSGRTLPEAKQ